MEEPKNSSSSNESQENEDSDNSQNNGWDISPKEEKNTGRKNYLTNIFIIRSYVLNVRNLHLKLTRKKKMILLILII